MFMKSGLQHEISAGRFLSLYMWGLSLAPPPFRCGQRTVKQFFANSLLGFDTATTHHMVCGADRGHGVNARALRPGLPAVGATGVGIATEVGDLHVVINPGATLSGALVQNKAKRSLMSVGLMTQKGYNYVQTRTFAALIHDTEPPIMGVRESNGMFRVALGTPGNRAEMLKVKVALDKGRKAMEGLRMRAYLEHLKEGCRPKDAHLCDGCDRGQHKKKPAKRGGRSEAARMKNRKKEQRL